MKKSALLILIIVTSACAAQEVLRVQNGGIVTVQNGVELTLQGGITLENGSGLANNGIIRLKNNLIANISNWTDLSGGGALIGTGKVIFNSTHNHSYTGLTDFYHVQMNAAGLDLNNHLTVSEFLELINGKINTGNYHVFLNNNSPASLINDASNTGYGNSWINGNFRRLITGNTSIYDFPVGTAVRSNLLQFLNNNINGTSYLTASFGPKPGGDAGINVSEWGADYTAVNDGGVWWLVPDIAPSGGNYALQLYFNGFAGLIDNQFGILKRPDSSSNAADWIVPAGSLLEPFGGAGRKLSDGYARRFNISDFSQWGIGMFANIPCEDCYIACTYGQGFYGNIDGLACFTDNSGNSSTVTTTQLMLNAFGDAASQVFGNVASKRFFTLYKTDISNGNIFNMLPGTGSSQVIGMDNISPYDGAYYDDQDTWYLVPITAKGRQKGTINNQLLSQTITLWFNLQTSNTLGAIDLSEDTLVTIAQSACGSDVPVGDPEKFGLPHNVVLYLNGGNGYSNNVNGLFQLANDVLGGVNTDLSPSSLQNAVATINMAFNECRILMRTIPYGASSVIMTKSTNINKQQKSITAENLSVTAYPNPYNKQFNLRITSPVSGMATIEYFTAGGVKIHQLRRPLLAHTDIIVPYKGPHHSGILLYRVTIGEHKANGAVIGIN